MLPWFLRSALDSAAPSSSLLPLFSLFLLSPFLSISLFCSLLLSYSLLFISFSPSISLSLSIFLLVTLSRPLSSSTTYFSLSPFTLCYHSHALSLFLFLSLAGLSRSRDSATELAIPQIVTASYRAIDSAAFLFFENLKNFLEARDSVL